MLTRAKKQMLINSALQNQLVLSEILSYLPFEDLKATRQVNHLWKDESHKYFKQRALVTFDFKWDYRRDQNYQFILKLDEFLDSRNSVQYHENYFIRQRHFTYGSDRHPDSYVRNSKAFKEKAEQLVQLHGANIRTLKLDLFIDGSTNFKFLDNVIKSVPQLKELELYIWLNNENYISKEDWTSDLTIEPLVQLKKFKLRSSNHAINSKYIPNLRQLLRKLLQLTQNVETLDLEGDSRTKYDTFYLEEIKEMKMEWVESKYHMPFKNLSSIKIEASRMDQLLELSQSQQLRKLSIYSHYLDLKEASLQELLKKHAKTLETLQIEYSISGDNEEGDGLVMNLEFPKLPKLKYLEVNVSQPYINPSSLPRMRLEVERGMLSFGLLESFMMGGEKFEEKFPLLQSFTWKIKYGHGFNPVIYERILPRPNQEADLCFPQFTSFNIPGPPTHNVYCSQEEYDEWMTWLAKLFPNVHSPQFNVARLPSQ